MIKPTLLLMITMISQQHMFLGGIKMDKLNNLPFHIKHFDAIFKQVEAQMDKKFTQMNLLNKILLPTQLEEKKEIIAEKTEIVLETIKPVKGYEQCITILEQILVDCGEIAKVIAAKDWQKILPLLLDLTNKVIEDVKCFKESNKMEIFQDYGMTLFGYVTDKRQCILDHLNVIVADAKDALNALMEGDLDTAKADFQKAVETFKDIQNC